MPPAREKTKTPVVEVNGEQTRTNAAADDFSTVKRLYEGKRDEEGYQRWEEEPPAEMQEIAARKTQRKAHPVVLRYVKSVDESGDKVFRLHSLVVQSEALKDMLRDILADYPGADQYGIHTDEPTFEPPFQPFYHRWDRFEAYVNSAHSSKDVQLLHSIIDAELQPIRSQVASLTRHEGYITFNLLWTLYCPGSLIFGRLRGADHVFVAKRTKKRQMPMGGPLLLDIMLDCIDFDGVKFGRCEETISIMEYIGEQRISSLITHPLEYHPDRTGLMKRLSARGDRYLNLAKGGYHQYNGLMYQANHFEPSWEDGRIVIDCAGFVKQNPYHCTPCRALQDAEQQPPPQSANSNVPAASQGGNAEADAGDDTITNTLSMDVVKEPELTDEQKCMTRSVVRGFSLTQKKWAEFQVDDITNIVWNEDAFSKLVMPQARKRLIRALIREQSIPGQKQSFDDIIQGKGQGLIMLLSGPPGTGKTLTGESIADALRLPLYYVTASELGDRIEDIEKSLTKVFSLAHRWHSVVLIDEADAFLEKRTDEMSPEARERSKRVAAFLRLLEYYKGTLLLTTNRSQMAFDDAFASRIHLRLFFRELDAETRKQIWHNFLSNLLPTSAAKEQVNFDALAAIEINGREIKNVVKMARLLAKSEREELSYSHIRDVMEVMEITLGEGRTGAGGS